MANRLSRTDRRSKRHVRIRKKIVGSEERPRLCVFRSLKHTYAQLIDDLEGKTLLAASTVKLDGKRVENGGNMVAAQKVGENLAKAALKEGITTVIFDRNGYLYRGRVKVVAESAREAGLKF